MAKNRASVERCDRRLEGTGATYSVDRFKGQEWDLELMQFTDASIYQAAAYGAARWGADNLTHVTVTRDGTVIAMAQARHVRFPLIGGGVAYVPAGPIWQRSGNDADTENLALILRALRKWLTVRGGVHLLVSPNMDSEFTAARTVFESEGFKWREKQARTIIMDIRPPLDELRSGTRRKWRQTLQKAERNALDVTITTDIDDYDIGLSLYTEMHQRKKFARFTDMYAFRKMQEQLPDPARMQILVCRDGEKPVAAIAWATVGNTGLPLLAATGAGALKSGAAYIMWWGMVKWLKEHGFEYCDLGGVNAERNPGGYTFKTGMGKTHGRDIVSIGDFDCYKSGLSHLAYMSARWLRNTRQNVTLWKERHRSAKGSKSS